MVTICKKVLNIGFLIFFFMPRDRRNLIPGNQSKHGHLFFGGGGVTWLPFIKKTNEF